VAQGKTPTVGIDIQLGEHEYRVQPQRHAYLKRELRKFVENLSSLGETAVDDLLDVGTDQVYKLLAVLIPDLMPKWEWDGYGTPQAAERDEYHQEADRSPTAPEIKGALQAAVQVNEFDWVGQLKNFIGPDLIRAQIRTALAQRAAEAAHQRQMKMESPQPSMSSPPQNGESAPTTSGTSAPTSAPPQPATLD